MTFAVLILVILAVAVTQALEGGTRPIFCLPGYALLALATIVGWWTTRRTPIPRKMAECLGAAVILCGYICVRAFFSPEEYLARNDLFVALGAMALYLVVALTLTSTKLRLLVVGALLALAVANCVIGAVQFLKGQNFMPFPGLTRPDYGTRASGFYGYPNHLSGFLEMALMLGLALTFWSRWAPWVKMLVGYVCGMCLLGILITGSRGGYISTAVGLLVIGLLSLVLIGKLAPGRVLALSIAGLFLIGGTAWGVRQVMSKSFLVSSRAEKTLTVDASRMRLWQAAWQQYRLQPAVGTGSGTYLYYGRQFRHPDIQTDPIHAHNDYLELFAEYGVIGIFCAIIFLETHLRSGWNTFRRRLSPECNVEGRASISLALTIGALSAAAACLTHSMLDFNLHMPANALVAAFVFALLSSSGEGPHPGQDQERIARLPAFTRLAALIVGVLIIAGVLPTAPAEYYLQRCRLIFSDWHHSISADLSGEMGELARRGLNSDPRNPKLYLCLGEAFSVQGDLATNPADKHSFHAQAIDAYTKALEFATGDVYTVLALGRALDAGGRLSESDNLFTRALKLDPSGGATHTAVAAHLLRQGNYSAAEAEYRLAIRFGNWLGGKAGLEILHDEIESKRVGAPTAPDSPKAP